MEEIIVFPDADSLSLGAAHLFISNARRAIEQRGEFNVALSGGSTPERLFQRLAEPSMVQMVAWEKVRVFWGDERTVPPDNPQSNYRMAKETLLDHVPVNPKRVYRIQGELEPQQAALRYEDLLKPLVDPSTGHGWPVFDLVFLGLGEDGHTASLFPETEALTSEQRWVVANFVPKLDTWRVTLTAPTINHAHRVVFLVSGGNKQDALYSILEGEPAPALYPAQKIAPMNGFLTWMVDQQAAAWLEED